MSDFSNAKNSLGAVFPDHATQTDFLRTEPLLTVDQLKSRYLFGIPLVSALVDPITNQRQVMTDDMLKDYIIRAVAKAELEVGIDIFNTERTEKMAFDRNLYSSFMYMQTTKRPIQSVLKLSINPANGQDIYIFPPDWIENNGFQRGRINTIPIQVAFAGTSVPLNNNGTGGATFLAVLSNLSWVSAYWEVQMVTGFKDGAIPKVVNELISMIACIDVLSMLGSTYRNTSHSLSLDGMAQSIAGPGPQIFQARIEMLEKQKQKIVNKLKAYFSIKITSSNI